MSRLECAAGVILNHRLSALVYFHPGPLTVITVWCVVVRAGVCVCVRSHSTKMCGTVNLGSLMKLN